MLLSDTRLQTPVTPRCPLLPPRLPPPLQRSEHETGQARDWVTRHFCLREDGTVVYFQNEADPIELARGVVPLSSYSRVEVAEVRPRPARSSREQLHEITRVPNSHARLPRPPLPPATSRASTYHLPAHHLPAYHLPAYHAQLAHPAFSLPAQPPHTNLPFAFQLTARDGPSDGAFVFAAPTDEERSTWMASLSSALTELPLPPPPPPGQQPVTSTAVDALAAQLGAMAPPQEQ